MSFYEHRVSWGTGRHSILWLNILFSVKSCSLSPCTGPPIHLLGCALFQHKPSAHILGYIAWYHHWIWILQSANIIVTRTIVVLSLLLLSSTLIIIFIHCFKIIMMMMMMMMMMMIIYNICVCVSKCIYQYIMIHIYMYPHDLSNISICPRHKKCLSPFNFSVFRRGRWVHHELHLGSGLGCHQEEFQQHGGDDRPEQLGRAVMKRSVAAWKRGSPTLKK